jgi:L-ornithine Nalpha-acyltransferase
MVVAHNDETKPVNIRAGDFELRLAEGQDEVEAAQALRFRVFYEEMAARPTAEMAAARRDFDDFDQYCDHLLVIDHRHGAGAAGVVGTYRLLRRSAAARAGGFYSADEFDISPLQAHFGEILELGRSCVGANHRSRAVAQLLWRGVADYVLYHNITLMFGCASLPGVDPDRLAVPLSYLHHDHLAPPQLRARALPGRYVAMGKLAVDSFDHKAALDSLPPLIKGYLRLGAFVGDGAVVDEQFHTTDVCIVVKTDWVTGRYYRHYTRDEMPEKGTAD